MDNTEKNFNENNEGKKDRFQRNKNRRNFRYSKRRHQNNNQKPQQEALEPAVAQNEHPAETKTEKKTHTSPNRDVKKVKPVKKPVHSEEKDTEPIDFTIGEFEDNGKKYIFKLEKRMYYIMELISAENSEEVEEKELFSSPESKISYQEWCKIKYPDKVKKSMM